MTTPPDDLKDSAPKLAGHSYDGIEELDNSLPNWWLNLLYMTVLFSVGYALYYMVGSGPSLVREYERARLERSLLELSKADSVKVASEDELRRISLDPGRRKLGASVFQARCVSCHGDHAQGGIGPNLTDDYWLHGGMLTEIAQTVRVGVSDKGMPPWGALLKPDEIESVVAFVRSLRGSNPPGAKAPQGVQVKHEPI